jgi:hypothetical protein
MEKKMRQRNSLLLLFLFLILLSGTAVQAQVPHKRILYVGIAGNGPGQGAFGHAFIVLSQNPGDFYDSVAYQYNIVVPNDFKLSPLNVYKLQSFPFKVFEEPGFSFINYYASQNRGVYLFQANLSPDVVGKIQDDLEKDKKDRDANQRIDYRLSDNNCVTKALDAINKYLQPEARLNYVPMTEMPTRFLFTGRDRISVSIPLSAPLALKRSSIFPKQYYFKAIEVKNYERVLEQAKTMQTLIGYCPQDPGVSDLLIRLTSNLKTNSSKAYIGLVKAQFGACVKGNSKAQNTYIALMDIIRYDASTSVADEIDDTVAALIN